MKKSIRLFGFFVLLSSIVTLMSSCKKDMTNLPGSWKAINAIIDNDKEDDLKDFWTLRTDGTCTIDCDIEEYFDRGYEGAFTFNGNYVPEGDRKLTITSEKFGEYEDIYYSQIVYDLDIVSLSKKTLKVSGTVSYYQHDADHVTSMRSNVSITLSKR